MSVLEGIMFGCGPPGPKLPSGPITGSGLREKTHTHTHTHGSAHHLLCQMLRKSVQADKNFDGTFRNTTNKGVRATSIVSFILKMPLMSEDGLVNSSPGHK